MTLQDDYGLDPIGLSLTLAGFFREMATEAGHCYCERHGPYWSEDGCSGCIAENTTAEKPLVDYPEPKGDDRWYPCPVCGKRTWWEDPLCSACMDSELAEEAEDPLEAQPTAHTRWQVCDTHRKLYKGNTCPLCAEES